MSSPSKNIRWRRRHIAPLYKLGSRVAAAYRRLVSKLETGAWGERAAARHLTRNGALPVKRNWHSGRLEADIISVEGNTIVVAEVKTRHARLMQHHPAISAITMQKRQRLERLGRSFVRNNGPLCRRFRLKHLRVDALEVYYERHALGFRRLTSMIWHRGLEIHSEELFA